ncbi:hypothetical protein [Hyalangium versicolor]|uniref:hypothetical protein n=1 Tax=Hyalangium versicolor TaxID=2861190 RepID=UPI001CCBF549|nr:hypothetical protein [Hyalangium versicolor]
MQPTNKAASADASLSVTGALSVSAPVPQEVASVLVEPPSPSLPDSSLDKEAVKALLEIALRGHDQLEKAYDTLNTRIGVVFGFSGFLATGFFKAAELLGPKWQAAACSGFAFLFAALAFSCMKAFSSTNYAGLPSSRALTRDFLHGVVNGETKIRYEILRVVNEANDENRPLIDQKAVYFQWAVKFLLAQVALILAVFFIAAVVRALG